jgi:hypothetical protein
MVQRAEERKDIRATRRGLFKKVPSQRRRFQKARDERENPEGFQAGKYQKEPLDTSPMLRGDLEEEPASFD